MTGLKAGVIGAGWFGEIHCNVIAGVPGLELAALDHLQLSPELGVLLALAFELLFDPFQAVLDGGVCLLGRFSGTVLGPRRGREDLDRDLHGRWG